MRAVCDPHFGAVQDKAVTCAVGSQAHTDNIRTRTGLAHGESADMFAADQLGQIAPFLLFTGISVNLIDAEVGVRTIRQGNGRRSAADLLNGDDMLQIGHSGAAILFGNGNAMKPQISHLAP